MNRFAALLDRLAYEPRRNAKLTLLTDYFRTSEDPERGFALAAMAGGLRFANAKPGMIRALIAARVDPVLFALSYDYVGDLSETAALIWPTPSAAGRLPPPSLGEVVETLQSARRADLPAKVAHWLDALDETGRWALLKLITGGLRIGVSARLAKSAVAALGALTPDDIEHVWHGLAPPYEALFAWAQGFGPRPHTIDAAPFRPPMLAHAIEDGDFDGLDAAAMRAEWKWDGIRVQAVGGRDAAGQHVARLYSRSGEDISHGFPDLLAAITFDGAMDGELLVLRDGRVQPFNELQQRLNRRTVSPRLLVDYPAHLRAYDLLADAGKDLRALPFDQRRLRLEEVVGELASPRVDLSPLIAFASWDELAAARADPAAAGAGDDARAVEGCMIKRGDSPYVPGRPKGLWYKWKHDPYVIDAVLMYAQRGHGKRSSFYSDYTFGLWREEPGGEALVPVGKAYFGFTDAELAELDRFVRRNTLQRFGPVREVAHAPDHGLVLEIAFEGIARSTRHKSGVAMRFPRVARIRWDKPPREADRLHALERLIRPRETDGEPRT